MSCSSIAGIVGVVIVGGVVGLTVAGPIRGDEPVGPASEVTEPLAECVRRVVDTSETWREHYKVPEGMGYYEQAHNHARAGWPLAIGKHARTRHEPGRGLYEIGGDSPKPPKIVAWPHRGEFDGLPHPFPGTIGRDFFGVHIPRKINLFSSFGTRQKGGYGAYRTDGPAIPDIFALKLIREAEGGEEGRATVEHRLPHGHNEGWGWSAVRRH